MSTSAEPAVDRATAFVVSRSAHRLIDGFRSRHGEAVLLCSWPTEIALAPAAEFPAEESDAVLGIVAGCPLIVDSRQFALSAVECILIDRRAARAGVEAADLVVSALPALMGWTEVSQTPPR